MVDIDIELLRRFQPPGVELTVDADSFTNWLGLRTDANMFPVADALRGTLSPDLPIDGDGVYGGYGEYAALLRAVERAAPRQEFTAVELGAGWGPWISAAGVVCRRMGFKSIRLLGLEADAIRYQMMVEHMRRNDLAGDDIAFHGVHGAAWKEDGTVFFGVFNDPVRDHGGAATDTVRDFDYRGLQAQPTPVEAYSVPRLCADYAFIDFMHWDIQGAEADVAEASIDFLCQRVRGLFIGTHSRAIEGRLLSLFHKHQWDVDHFHECTFVYDRTKPTLEAMSLKDGEISLVNPHLGSRG